MSIGDIKDREHVLKAIAEFDAIGREAFLAKYGFGRAHAFWLSHEGKLYDSKAVLGAAHQYARPDLGPLKAEEFSGGEKTVGAKLRKLRFEVPPVQPAAALERASERLEVDRVYTRDDLRDAFGITDATLNTGVFRPRGMASVWLFVTEEKTADRTQYHDQLEGDLLHWQGQTSGRTDDLVINHRAQGLELLLFIRRRKYEFTGAGFRYAGAFRYESHTGARPTSFTLRRDVEVAAIPSTAADPAPFDPTNFDDARKRILATITRRRGQQKFRNELIAAYEGRCAISGCAVLDVLEAAHIYPYRGDETNVVSNGLLLRADLHTLFDLRLLNIEPKSLTVMVAPELQDSEYGSLHGQPLRPAKLASCAPSAAALALRLNPI